PNAGTRSLVGLGRPLAQEVNSPMHVGVVRAVVGAQRIDHRLRLLGRGGVVEIDERMAVDVLVQGRKVLADALDLDFQPSQAASPAPRPAPSRALSRPSSQALTGAGSTRSSTSLAKPWVSSARAAASSRPRLSR